MRPSAANHVPAHVQPLPPGRTPTRDQAVHSPLHRLQDVKLDPPYSQKQIDAYLQERQIRSTGDLAFDACLFQSVLFTDFLEKVETGEVTPGQPEHDLPAQYLLKKCVDLLQPLGLKIETARLRYDAMLSSVPPELGAKLEKELNFVKGMTARFETLESNLLDALGHPEDFQPTRDKACFLLFAHAMLSDAANEIQRWMNELSAAPGARVYLLTLTADDEKSVRNYVTKDVPRSNLFSPGPLTQEDAALFRKVVQLTYEIAGSTNSMVPSFTQTGGQGLLAMLHAMFQGKVLMSGAAGRPYPVHANSYDQVHLRTLRHDCGHLMDLLSSKALQNFVPAFAPIFGKLENPPPGLPSESVKKDLVVLWYVLHEDSIPLLLPERDKAFLDYARLFFKHDNNAVDTASLLNKVGFSIAPVDEKSSAEEKAARSEAVAQGMSSLWKEFRARHPDELVASGLFARLPKFFAD